MRPIMSSLANSRVILRSNNTLLVQKSSSSLHSNFNLTLYIIYELDYGCVILAIILHLPFFFVLFGTVKLMRNTITSMIFFKGRGIAFCREGSWSFSMNLLEMLYNVLIY